MCVCCFHVVSYPDGGFRNQAAPKVFTILDLLTRLGDAREPPSRTTAAELVAALSTQADAVKIEIMDDEKKEKLVLHLLKCIVALPTKTALFGTLIGLVSADVPTLSDEILRKTNDELTLAFQRSVSPRQSRNALYCCLPKHKADIFILLGEIFIPSSIWSDLWLNCTMLESSLPICSQNCSTSSLQLCLKPHPIWNHSVTHRMQPIFWPMS